MQRNSRQIWLRKDLWDKTNLTQKEILRAQATLRQLHDSGAATPGLNLKRIQGSDPLRSVRVTNDLRMVLHLAGNEIFVLHVDRHDNTYEWAQKNNGTDRLKSLTARQNLIPYAPPDGDASGRPPALAGDAGSSGSVEALSANGASKPGTGSDAPGRGRQPREDYSAKSAAAADDRVDAALEFWKEEGVDVSAIKPLLGPCGGPVLVLGAAGTDIRPAANIRSLYLAAHFADDDQHVLLLTHSERTYETTDVFLDTAEAVLGRGTAVDVLPFDLWLQQRLEDIDIHLQVVGDNRRQPLSLWRAQCDSEETAASLRLEWQEVIQPCGVEDAEAWRGAAARTGRSRFADGEMTKLWPVFDQVREALRTQGLVTRDDACRMVRRALEDGSLSPATAAVVVLDCQNLGPQAVRLCRELALATVPKHERWDRSQLERLCLVADPFQRTDFLHLNIQECDITPARTVRMRQSGILDQRVIDTAVLALQGQEFDDLAGGVATLDGYRSIVSGEPPAFRRHVDIMDGAQQVADWLRGLEETYEDLTRARICLVARTGSRLKDWRKALRPPGSENPPSQARQRCGQVRRTRSGWPNRRSWTRSGTSWGLCSWMRTGSPGPVAKPCARPSTRPSGPRPSCANGPLFYLTCTRAQRDLLFCSRDPFASWLQELAPPAPAPEPASKSPVQLPARSPAMKYPVLIDQEITDEMLQVLHDRGCDTYMWNPDGKTPRMEETVGFFVYGHALIDGPIMDRMPKLKVISNMGVGVDHIRVPDAAERGIAVGNTPGFVDGATADMAFLLMMAIARNLKKGIDYARGPEFRHFDPTLWHGREINGATLGIYGMGAIGSTVARRASGFNMHVIYHNRNRLSDTREAELNAYWVPRSSLLARSDYLLLSLPLNEETEGCMGLAEFRQMQAGAFLINIGRGGLVRTEELVTALEEGQLAGAALDVTEPEPLPRDHPLVEHPDVIITPHLGSATVETREGMFIRTVENLMAGMQDKPLLNQVLQ